MVTLQELKNDVLRRDWAMPLKRDIETTLKFCNVRHSQSGREYTVDPILYTLYQHQIKVAVQSPTEVTEVIQLLFYISGNQKRHEDLSLRLRNVHETTE